MSPYELTWENIQVIIKEKTTGYWKTTCKQKKIINNVSGHAKSGSLFAILGSSGCGKTTFLSALAGRYKDKKGNLYLNGRTVSDETIKKVSGYVHQENIFTEYLTTLEHLKFMAALQLNHIDSTDAIISRLLKQLSLEEKRSSLIKTLSGGEKRKLALADQLMRRPCILFCDEPTTGLDSYNAAMVVQKLQATALSGKIVLVTIHQPSSQTLEYFDNIILLAEGKLAFQGTRQETKAFFESMNLVCPPNYSLGDFYLQCLSSKNLPNICERFEARIKMETQSFARNKELSLERKTKNSFFREVRWLLWRNFLKDARNKMVYIVTYGIVMVEIIVVALFYSNISLNSKESVQSIEGFLSFIGTEFVFTNMYAIINVFPEEVGVFLKEKSLYSTSSYFTSKILSTIPPALLSTAIYMMILFVILSFLNGFESWLQMTYLMFLVSVASCALGLAFSATLSTLEQIDLYIGSLEFVFMLMSGVLLKLDSVPWIFRWIKYLSPFYYGFDSLSNILWKEVINFGTCTRNDTAPCYTNGTEVLVQYGVYKAYNAVVYDIFYLHLLTIVFCLIGFAGLCRKRNVYNI